MPTFRYKAIAADGSRDSGAITAEDDLSALVQLGALGLTVTALESGSPSVPTHTIGRNRARGVSLAQQAALADQLATVFASGLPTPEVVRIVAQTSSNPVIRRHFSRMGQLIAEGAPFDQALDTGSAPFSPLFGILARIGQYSGQPGQQMPALAHALRRQARMGAQIGTALVYPGIVLTGGLGIIIVMALFLAPRLEVIFTSVDQPVPGTIVGFVSLGAVLRTWGLPLLAATLIAGHWLRLQMSSPSLRRLVRSFPLIGPVLQEAALAQLTRACLVMLEAGLPLAEALHSAASAFAPDPMARPFAEAATALEEGKPASSVLASDPALPILLREMFRIGEETNSLTKVLASTAQGLEDAVERRLTGLIGLLSPALTLLVGGVIALIVASVMGAVLSVNDLAL